MTINRNNFEAYLLDYLEGTLDPLLTADLMAFLAENPEFETYLPDYDGRSLAAESVQFGNKNMLKKDFADVPEINPGNFDEFCIGLCEGLLNTREIERLDNYLAQNPEKQKDLALFKSLRLQPDTSIIYAGKADLKKQVTRSFRVRYLYIGLGIAASVALLIFISLNRLPEGTHEIQIVTSSNNDADVDKIEPEVNAVIPAPVLSESRVITSIREKEQDSSRFISTPETYRDPLLATLEPLESMVQPADIITDLSLNMPITSVEIESVASTNIQSPEADEPSFLKSLVARIDFWKTAETAISSINYLTESKLSISKTTDENGNLTGLLLNTESYTIEGNKTR